LNSYGIFYRLPRYRAAKRFAFVSGGERSEGKPRQKARASNDAVIVQYSIFNIQLFPNRNKKTLSI
jgi:hypothetical protein